MKKKMFSDFFYRTQQLCGKQPNSDFCLRSCLSFTVNQTFTENYPHLKENLLTYHMICVLLLLRAQNHKYS